MSYVNVVYVNFVNSIYTNYVNKLCYNHDNLARKQLCVRVFEKAVLKSLEISQSLEKFQQSPAINITE